MQPAALRSTAFLSMKEIREAAPQIQKHMTEIILSHTLPQQNTLNGNLEFACVAWQKNDTGVDLNNSLLLFLHVLDRFHHFAWLL